ncbi:MAG: hypothetical protein QT07_C0007G0024 [archaeon GW2011_AR16]|nr:MAG: hypothetical protein QT07_C0007G0024 [archaeon GW2011_AR16]HIH46939.1 hypothetical protein [Candidatus Woesearchaeota archaeon]HII89125.1 hypothetical protein [Candidatus Woesearchaeota archaeon]
MGKKAQMQMGETIMVLLVFFIIITIGLVIYGTYQAGQIKQSIREAFDRDAVVIALRVSFLPEVTCSENNVVEENCFDIEKIRAFKSEMVNGANDDMFLFYVGDLKKSKISVKQLFPLPVENQVTELYNNIPPENERAEQHEIIPTFIPISLKDPTRRAGKEYAFGVLTVEVYKEG